MTYIYIYIYIYINIIITIIIIIIIDHASYMARFGGESISVLFERHCLPLLIRSNLIGKPY